MATNQLFEDMEELRGDEPMIWAVINGAHSVARLCDVLNWPLKKVQRELEALVSEKLLVIQSGHVILLHFHGREEDPVYLRRKKMMELARKIRAQIMEEVEDMPDFKKDRAALRRQTRTGGKRKPGDAPTELTAKQAEDLQLCLKISKGGMQPIRPIDLAKAKGYAKAGFSGTMLAVLATKGYLQEVEGTRFKSYEPTPAGVDKWEDG